VPEPSAAPPSIRFGPVLLFTDHLQECRRFYEAGLGLVPASSRDGYVEYRLANGTLALHAAAEPRGARGPVALHLVVDDIEEMAERLRAAGFPPDGAPADQPWGRELSLIDPGGFAFDLLELPA
jgi:catechol 2,3-dioxygenase-like lactoylglutathione lyase family enzyme